METQKTGIVKTILISKNSWRNQRAWLQIIMQRYSHQESMVLAKKTKKGNIDKWNKIESSEINPQTYGQLIFDRRGKTIQCRRDRLFNKQYKENLRAKYKNNEIRTLPITIHKNKLKMDQRFKWKPRNYEAFRGKFRKDTLT